MRIDGFLLAFMNQQKALHQVDFGSFGTSDYPEK